MKYELKELAIFLLPAITRSFVLNILATCFNFTPRLMILFIIVQVCLILSFETVSNQW